MLELNEQEPKGPVVDPEVTVQDDGKKFLEEVAAKEKAAEDERIRNQALAAALEAKRKRAVKDLVVEPKPEPKPEPKLSPDYPIGREFGRGGVGGSADRVVVDKEKFYRLCIRMVRTEPRLATMYVRMIGELLGIENYKEAHEKWQQINSYFERNME